MNLVQHESGLCKSLLQEYTQKRKLPLPLYTVIQTSFEKNIPYFCATVEIGGIQYKGGVSKNRKHAAILAAKAALIAISSDPGPNLIFLMALFVVTERV